MKELIKNVCRLLQRYLVLVGKWIPTRIVVADGRLFFSMSEDIVDEALKDARILAKRFRPDDYAVLQQYWQRRNFDLIAFMLRRYGIEFKGVTHLEILVEELIKIREGRQRT